MNLTIDAFSKRLSIFFLLCINVAFSQKDEWIDKNENENYIARHECSFVQAGDKFIMFGGREKAQQLDVYDFKKNTWSIGGKAPKEFNHFQATSYEGFVWVIGSFKTNKFPKEIPADNIWLYFPPTKTWIKGPEIPEDRRRGGAGLVVHNDKFYLIGGNTIGHDGGYVPWFDVYDPILNTWTILEDAPNARDHFSAVVANNKIYAVGGRHSGGDGGVFTPLVALVDVYDFETNTWSSLKNPLPTPRAAPGVALFNKEIFVMGGEGEKQGAAFKTVEAYNLQTNTWSPKKDMHYPRHGTQAIVSGEGIYIAGGSPVTGGGRQLNMEVYNLDKPKGIPVKASSIKAPKTIYFSANSTKEITLGNTSGNTGSFITSIALKGKDKDKFKIDRSLIFTLLKYKEKVSFNISYLGNKSYAIAALHIEYNGTHKKIIRLISKN